MKILFLEEQPCIRAFKYAKGLRFFCDKIELDFAYCGKTLNDFYGQGDELFNGWYKIKNGNNLEIQSTVKRVNPDILHCHNAPDSLTVACIHFFKGKIPIIHDVHDLLSVRNTGYDDGIVRGNCNYFKITEEEKIAFERSDGIIAVSGAILDLASKKYDLDSRRSLVFPNFIATDMVPRVLKNKLSGGDDMINIVYEGHLDRIRSGGHYDLFDIFKGIANQGINIHIYPSRENEIYKKLSKEEGLIHYHGSIQPVQLLNELTKYDFGWAGFNTSRNRVHTDTVMANKIFDYIAAGLPVLSFPHKSQKNFLKSNSIGIIVSDLKGLKAKLLSPFLKEVKKHVLEKRFFFTMENQIGKVYRFYEEVMAYVKS